MKLKNIIVVLIISIIVVLFAAWLASSHPDGLEWVAEKLHFIDKGEVLNMPILPDYNLPGKEGILSTFIAGTLGVVITFVAVYVIGYFVKK